MTEVMCTCAQPCSAPSLCHCGMVLDLCRRCTGPFFTDLRRILTMSFGMCQ
jgi:hypothetical protein